MKDNRRFRKEVAKATGQRDYPHLTIDVVTQRAKRKLKTDDVAGHLAKKRKAANAKKTAKRKATKTPVNTKAPSASSSRKKK